MILWLAAAAVATLWCLLALVWLAVLVPLARDPTDDPRGEAPATADTDQTHEH